MSYPARAEGLVNRVTKTIQVRRARHVGHCWRSKDELISDGLLWTPSHRRAKVGRPARTYLLQFCANTGCSLEDLPGAMDDRGRVAEEVQGNPCKQHDIMLMTPRSTLALSGSPLYDSNRSVWKLIVLDQNVQIQCTNYLY